MADDAEVYFDRIVVSTFRAFIAAENALTVTGREGTPEELEAARDAMMGAAWSSAIAIHQMGDYVLAAKPAWLPSHIGSEQGVRDWLQANHCKMLRGAPIDDVSLLGDLADAFKHSELKPRKVPRKVTSAKATVTMGTGYGKLAFGEGKYGGGEQTVVTLADGSERALSSVLQNVMDAWRTALGRPLPPMNE